MHAICTKCRVEKPLDEFNIHRGAKNGRQSACKECAKSIRKKWSSDNAERQRLNFATHYQKNKVTLDAACKKWNSENVERRREISRSSNAQHADRVKQTGALWRNANRQLMRQRYAQRRALKHQSTPAWANSDKIAEFYATADGLGMHTGDWYEVDHIVPLKSKIVCGLHCEANLQVLVRRENRSKSNRYWPDMPA